MKKKVLSLVMAASMMVSAGIINVHAAKSYDHVKYYDDSLKITLDENNNYVIGPYEPGDVNRDGKVNAADIVRLSAYMKHKIDPNKVYVEFDNGYCLTEAEFMKALGDVKSDGKINVTDITVLAAHVKGKKTINTFNITWPIVSDTVFD